MILARVRAVAGFAVFTLAGTLAVSPPPVARAATIFVEYTKPSFGPRGPITVIGDSVMLGNLLEVEGYGPSVSQMLVDRGWGPVLAKAGVGFQAGLNVQSNNGADMSKFVRDKRAQGWDSSVYVISIGPNDVLSCNSTPACSEKDIRGLVDTIGPDHEIWWSLITMTKQSDADVWNDALAAVGATRPNLHLWDWPTIQAKAGIPLSTKDHIHLPTGAAYVQRSILIADDVTARFGMSNRVGAVETAPATIGSPSEYQPVALQRALDTRDGPARVQAATTVELDLSTRVPALTTAVSVNLTAVEPSRAGFLTAYPCDRVRPTTSNVNFLAGEIRPNHVVVGLGAGSRLCVFSSATTDVVVDLEGAFVPSGALRLTPLSPTRLVDTRVTGRADPVVVAMPAGSPPGAVLNVTAVGAVAPGYLVVYPCDVSPIPKTSNLNFVTGDAVAGSVYAQVSAVGTVCVHANVAVDLTVDLQGELTSSGALRFQAANPQRMLDTRVATGGWRGQLGVAQTVDFVVAPPQAQAVTGNITMIQPALDGFATAFGCTSAAPGTSSVNAARATIAANSVTAGASSSLCVSASVGVHIIFDTTGWWVP